MATDQHTDFELLHTKLKIARKQILDIIHTAYGHEPSWPNVRARILKILGRDGLESPFLQSTANGSTDHHEQQKI